MTKNELFQDFLSKHEFGEDAIVSAYVKRTQQQLRVNEIIELIKDVQVFIGEAKEQHNYLEKDKDNPAPQIFR